MVCENMRRDAKLLKRANEVETDNRCIKTFSPLSQSMSSVSHISDFNALY